MEYVDKGAVISPDERYRYILWRQWREGRRLPCIFIMLNPSTADSDADDPTIRKCVGFADRWGFSSLTILNLFAFRATQPSELLAADDPVGPYNGHHIRQTLSDAVSCRVVCAWGAHGDHLGQDQKVIAQLDGAGMEYLCALGLTIKGQPSHPLYRRYDEPVIRYNPL